MLILGIESTCDETSIAVVKDGRQILSNVVATQIDLHDIYGGVVPELACRRHVDVIVPVLKESLAKAGVSLQEIDGIAVASMPGLIGALLIGVHCAKSLSLSLSIPYVGVNHIEAHLYAAIMESETEPELPALGVIISGGHTVLIEITGIGIYRPLGTTIDDAIGEAFDKVAKILGFSYPGGPKIEKLAKNGNPNAYPYKPGRVKGKPLDFSFSGLKTAVLYSVGGQNTHIKDLQKNLSLEQKQDVAASFQKTAFKDLISKISLTNYKTVIFGGGVANSQTLRTCCSEAFPDRKLFWPSPALSLDNGAMIAGLGYHMLQKNPKGDPLNLEATPSFSGF